MHNTIEIALKGREQAAVIRYQKEDQTQDARFEEDVLKLLTIEDEAWLHLSNGYDADLTVRSREVVAYAVNFG